MMSFKMADKILRNCSWILSVKYLYICIFQKEDQERAKQIAEQLRAGVKVEVQPREEEVRSDSGRSLADMGIDMSFLDALGK